VSKSDKSIKVALEFMSILLQSVIGELYVTIISLSPILGVIFVAGVIGLPFNVIDFTPFILPITCIVVVFVTLALMMIISSDRTKEELKNIKKEIKKAI
jgi:hypothetical protein